MAKGFLLHFTGRSGSTYFIYRMRNHPKVVARLESFGTPVLPGGMEQTADNQITYLRKLWRPYHREKALPADKAIGFKLQHSVHDAQARKLRRVLKVASEYDVMHYVLRRRNRLAQLISSLVARNVQKLTRDATGQKRDHLFAGMSVTPGAVRDRKVQVDPDDLIRRLQQLDRSYAVLDLVEKTLPSVRSFFYEDMVAEGPAFFESIFRELELPPHAMATETETERIVGEDFLAVVENREALEQKLKKSRFAAYLG